MTRTQPELELGVVEHNLAENPVSQRTSDGYVNATAMCKAAGKRWNDYTATGPAKAFLEALAVETGIPVSTLCIVIHGGKHQGAWVHPQVAIHLAQWCSPQFAVAVTQWVFDWMTGRLRAPSLPYHLRRYIANREAIPHTHFSMLNELMLHIIAPMEAKGYPLPESLVPDISTGRMFSDWLRKAGVNPEDFPTYPHRYDDGRIVEARLYPNALLEPWREYLNTVWIPSRMVPYFAERDRRALDCIATAWPELEQSASGALRKLAAKEAKLIAEKAAPPPSPSKAKARPAKAKRA